MLTLEEIHNYLHATFLVSSLCVAVRSTAGDRGTGARVWNENESLRISISPALTILSIL